MADDVEQKLKRLKTEDSYRSNNDENVIYYYYISNHFLYSSLYFNFVSTQVEGGSLFVQLNFKNPFFIMMVMKKMMSEIASQSIEERKKA